MSHLGVTHLAVNYLGVKLIWRGKLFFILISLTNAFRMPIIKQTGAKWPPISLMGGFGGKINWLQESQESSMVTAPFQDGPRWLRMVQDGL